mmetsp:Transcript_11677/g.27390  ORF Transcript_11677/g.27390 Transcript_11677/m.27390 type:complete len:233 (-) Transcript_11677:272-970(-)
MVPRDLAIHLFVEPRENGVVVLDGGVQVARGELFHASVVPDGPGHAVQARVERRGQSFRLGALHHKVEIAGPVAMGVAIQNFGTRRKLRQKKVGVDKNVGADEDHSLITDARFDLMLEHQPDNALNAKRERYFSPVFSWKYWLKGLLVRTVVFKLGHCEVVIFSEIVFEVYIPTMKKVVGLDSVGFYNVTINGLRTDMHCGIGSRRVIKAIGIRELPVSASRSRHSRDCASD